MFQRKASYKNYLWAILFAVLLFSPLGLSLKVWILRAISTAPAIEQGVPNKISYQGQYADLQGQLHQVSQWKGQVVLVSFWASWCPPCLAEMPSLQELYNQYGNRVSFVLLTDSTRKEVEDFVQKNGYTLPMYINPIGFDPQLISRSIPATYLIDKQGQIQIKKIGMANWNSSQVHTLLDRLLVN